MSYDIFCELFPKFPKVSTSVIELLWSFPQFPYDKTCSQSTVNIRHLCSLNEKTPNTLSQLSKKIAWEVYVTWLNIIFSLNLLLQIYLTYLRVSVFQYLLHNLDGLVPFCWVVNYL